MAIRFLKHTSLFMCVVLLSTTLSLMCMTSTKKPVYSRQERSQVHHTYRNSNIRVQPLADSNYSTVVPQENLKKPNRLEREISQALCASFEQSKKAAESQKQSHSLPIIHEQRLAPLLPLQYLKAPSAQKPIVPKLDLTQLSTQKNLDQDYLHAHEAEENSATRIAFIAAALHRQTISRGLTLINFIEPEPTDLEIHAAKKLLLEWEGQNQARLPSKKLSLFENCDEYRSRNNFSQTRKPDAHNIHHPRPLPYVQKSSSLPLLKEVFSERDSE